jgi:hypothetical protein
MVRAIGNKPGGARVAVAVGLSAAALSAWPISPADAGELQPGGFIANDYGLPGLAKGASGLPEGLGHFEIGAGNDAAYPSQFAPSSVSMSPGSRGIKDFIVTEGAAGASPGLGAALISSEPARSEAQSAISYFTPRFSGLQFGASYAPPRPEGAATAVSVLQSGQDPTLRSDLVLGVSYLDSFQGIDIALSGGYRSASLPAASALDVELLDQDAVLERYSVGTSIGFSGLRLGGFYAREAGDGPISVQSWDAGISYATGPWTIGVDYLRSAFADTRGLGSESPDELHTLQAGLTYSVGTGIVASFNVLHSSLEDSQGKGTTGTLGILGFSYNF